MDGRIVWVDFAKGIGIALVVVGHTLIGLLDANLLPRHKPELLTLGWIYAFHMPLFFFISGLFAERQINRPFQQFLNARLRTVAYPYLLWSVISVVVGTLGARFANHPVNLSQLAAIPYAPPHQFWFLYVLFLIAVGYAILRRLGLPTLAIAALALLAHAAPAAGVRLGDWGVVYQVCEYAVYFAAGALVGGTQTLEPLDRLRVWKAVSLGLIGYAVVAVGVLADIQKLPWLVPVLAACGIAATLGASLALSRWPRLPGALGWLQREIHTWGTLSLPIFVAHSLFSATLRIALEKLAGVTQPVLHLTLGVLVGLYGPIFLHRLTQRLRIDCLFVWPARRTLASA